HQRADPLGGGGGRTQSADDLHAARHGRSVVASGDLEVTPIAANVGRGTPIRRSAARLPGSPRCPALRAARLSALPGSPRCPALRAARLSALPGSPRCPALRAARLSALPGSPRCPALRAARLSALPGSPRCPALRAARL